MLQPDTCFLPPRSQLYAENEGGNREYGYFGGLKWKDAEICVGYERELLDLLRAGGDERHVKTRFIVETIIEDDTTGLSADDIDDKTYDEQPFYDEAETLIYVLDAGWASAVAALYAAGCPPITSCNGGAFSKHHQYDEPTIVFYASPRRCELLNAAAKRSGVRLETSTEGIPMAVAESPEQFVDFAEALAELRKTIKRAPALAKRDKNDPVRAEASQIPLL